MFFKKKGTWYYVLTDDLVPYENGRPVGATCCPPNNWWVLLIEKAYAKFFGGYATLFSGFPDEALVDFTGCPVEKFSLTKKAGNNMNAFWNELYSLMVYNNNANNNNVGINDSSSSGANNSAGAGISTIVGCSKMENSMSKTAAGLQDDHIFKYIHVDSGKLSGMSQSELFDTGLLRNMMYSVVDLQVIGGRKCVLVKGFFKDSGSWRGKQAKRAAATSYWMYFEDWMAVFTNCFVVLPVSGCQRFQFSSEWTSSTCGFEN